MSNDLVLTRRGASLDDLVTLLREQHARKVDYVAPAGAIRFDGGNLVLPDGSVQLDDDGVTQVDGAYRPTDLAVADVAGKLNIDLRYLRRLFAERPDLFDANANGLLRGWSAGQSPDRDGAYPSAGEADKRRFLLRLFRGDDGTGIMRAMLSDSYAPIDNLDVLFAALAGVAQAGVEAEIPANGADLSESRMSVRLVAPEVKAYAPALLKGYHSPWADPDVYRVGSGGWTPQSAIAAARAEGQLYSPGEEPVTFAGLRVGNSETGGGAFSIAPVVVFRVCGNGLPMVAHAVNKVHLGGKLAEGQIKWAEDTRKAELELITKKARDAVVGFLNPAFIAARVAELEEKAGVPVKDPSNAITEISKDKRLAFSEAEQANILDKFIRGGQFTAGGVMQAVTAAAQAVDDPDRAARLEDTALVAMEVAARLR